jgi:multiple sugar transport system substrate-binding protein
MKSSLRKVLALILCVMVTVSFLLTGCGGQKAAESSSEAVTTAAATSAETTKEATPEPATITMGAWPSDSDPERVEQFEALAAQLMKENPWITLKPQQLSYDPVAFVPLAESGQLPNMFGTWATEPIKLANAGYLADITAAVKSRGWDTKYNPNILKMYTKDDKIYALPTDGYSLGLNVNMKVFKEAGLVDASGLPQIPTTFDELAQTSKLIKEKTGKAGMILPSMDGMGGWQFSQVAWNFGTEFLTNVDGKWKATFNSPEGVAALQWYKDMKWTYNALPEGALIGGDAYGKLIGSDQAAMRFGTDNYFWLQGDFKMSLDTFAMGAMPKGPKANYALTGGSCLAFSAGSTDNQILACMKFMDLVGNSPEYSESNIQGVEKELKNNNEQGWAVGIQGLQVFTDPQVVAGRDAAYKKYTNLNLDLFKGYIEQGVSGNLRAEHPYLTQDIYKELDTAIQAVFTDKNADLKALLDTSAANIQKLLDRDVNK